MFLGCATSTSLNYQFRWVRASRLFSTPVRHIYRWTLCSIIVGRVFQAPNLLSTWRLLEKTPKRPSSQIASSALFSPGWGVPKKRGRMEENARGSPAVWLIIGNHSKREGQTNHWRHAKHKAACSSASVAKGFIGRQGCPSSPKRI